MIRDRTASDGGPKLPPHSVEVEQSVLGAILSRNSLLGEACGDLKSHHFFDHRHRHVFDVMAEMIREGRKADPLTLNAVLPTKDLFAAIGLTVPQYTTRLVAETLSECPEHIQLHVRELDRLAWKRDFQAGLEDMQNLLAKGEPADLLSALRETTTAIERSAPTSTTATRFKLVKIDDIQTSTTRDYAIKGLIPRTGLVIVWGPPKCGKSFWVFALMMHVAMGREYRGHRVHQNEVAYLALEGQEGFGDRRDAFYKHHLEPGETVPLFKFLGTTLDLVKDHTQLIADIKAQSAKPGCVVIDTMNRSLNGSESSDEDMSAYLRAADAIQHAFNCVVIIIHHCGHDQSRPRGHSSQIGAADVQISVKKDAAGIITSTVELAKDMAEGATFASKLEVVKLSLDQDGDDITSCVVVPAETDPQEGQAKAQVKLTAEQRRFLDIVTKALIEAGIVPNDTTTVPRDVRAVTREIVKRYCVAGGWVEEAATDKGRTKVNGMLNTLAGKHLIGLTDRYVWLPRR
jgi:hypothetical protein